LSLRSQARSWHEPSAIGAIDTDVAALDTPHRRFFYLPRSSPETPIGPFEQSNRFYFAAAMIPAKMLDNPKFRSYPAERALSRFQVGPPGPSRRERHSRRFSRRRLASLLRRYVGHSLEQVAPLDHSRSDCAKRVYEATAFGRLFRLVTWASVTGATSVHRITMFTNPLFLYARLRAGHAGVLPRISIRRVVFLNQWPVVQKGTPSSPRFIRAHLFGRASSFRSGFRCHLHLASLR
jgi:hypothetical protein